MRGRGSESRLSPFVCVCGICYVTSNTIERDGIGENIGVPDNGPATEKYEGEGNETDSSRSLACIPSFGSSCLRSSTTHRRQRR